jgi:hypothetical protein
MFGQTLGQLEQALIQFDVRSVDRSGLIAHFE